MSDDNKGFTVKDRRLFTADGELRGPETEEGRPGPSAPAQPSPAAPPPQEFAESAPGVGTDVDFASFLMSLAAQAGALLEGGGAHELEGARQMISILEMLERKTQGRRTPEEDRLLERLLYELRMAYVERSRAARA
jgi:hypothetical protein